MGFQTCWADGELPWPPTALSTLKPATASPHLSVIKLDLYSVDPITRSAVEDAGNDIRWAIAEVARIEREFEGAANLAVFLDRRFEPALGALSVRFHICGVDGTPDPIDPFSFIYYRSNLKKGMNSL